MTLQGQQLAPSCPNGFWLSDFRIQRTLGTGSFGRVHLAWRIHDRRFYAIKVLAKELLVRKAQVEHANNEKQLLSDVHHPFIVNYWGAFQDSNNLYMVMDFVPGGELFSLLRRARVPQAKFYAAEVALAVNYLHTKNIIYRDLKPENILLGADGHIKLADFGFAKVVHDITWTICGTPDYLAPEVIAKSHYNKSVDWYSLGILIFEMLEGCPPFYSEDPDQIKLYDRILAGHVRYPTEMEPNAINLIRGLLCSDLSQRYGNMINGADDIFNHPWFEEVPWGALSRKEILAAYIPNILGEWDSSAFEQQQETDVESYGALSPDPHGHFFPSFDYTW